MNIRNLENREDLRRQIYNMYIRQWRVTDIAENLGIPEEEVEQHIRAHKESLQVALLDINPKQYAMEVRAKFSALQEEAWTKYYNAKRDADKVRYLRLIGNLVESETRSLQEAGILEKKQAPFVQQTTVNVLQQGPSASTRFTLDIDEPALEALTVSLLAKEMGITPEEALQLRGKDPTYILPAHSDHPNPLTIPHNIAKLPQPVEQETAAIMDFDFIEADKINSNQQSIPRKSNNTPTEE